MHHPNEPMPGGPAGGGADEDDDVVLEGAGAGTDFARNTRCPITGLEVRHGPTCCIREGRKADCTLVFASMS